MATLFHTHHKARAGCPTRLGTAFTEGYFFCGGIVCLHRLRERQDYGEYVSSHEVPEQTTRSGGVRVGRGGGEKKEKASRPRARHVQTHSGRKSLTRPRSRPAPPPLLEAPISLPAAVSRLCWACCLETRHGCESDAAGQNSCFATWALRFLLFFRSLCSSTPSWCCWCRITASVWPSRGFARGSVPANSRGT